jgi:hypothetical protein
VGNSLSQVPDQPILIAKFTPPFDPVKDSSAIAVQLLEFLDKSAGTVYYIADMRDIKIKFSDLVMGMAQAFTDPQSPYANPRVRTYTVASDLLINLGAKAASEQQQYGKANVKMFKSVDEALAEIRKQMAKS